MKTFIFSVICIFCFQNVLNANLIQISQNNDQKLNQIYTEFFVSSFMGRKVLQTQGEQNPFTFEINTETQQARSGELSFIYSPISQNWERRQAVQKIIQNPFPNPPEIITFDIIENISINGLSGSGRFSTTNFENLQGNSFLLRLSEITSEFQLNGLYTISSYNMNINVPFSYSISSIPENTRGILRMDSIGPQVEESYYVLSPSTRTLYSGSVEGYDILAQLNPISVPVTVPEPSMGLFFSLLILGFIFFIFRI